LSRRIKILVVDDSAVVRQTLQAILDADPLIDVIATASDPYVAAKKIQKQAPDVITLDIEMPRMDGITFLKKIMTQHPIPVVVCSSLTVKGSETLLKAMEYGAVDIIEKPRISAKKFLEESRIIICDAVKAASVAKLKKIPARSMQVRPKLTADAVLSKPKNLSMVKTTEQVIVVGASTGGTEALKVFLEALPEDFPGIVIVQHMPGKFTTAFARRLDTTCRVSVREASDNDTVLRGHALITPGNRHALIKRSGARYYVEVKEGPLVNRHRPSVDVLFRSAARYAGKNAVGIIMTGMGDDGAKGMLEMKEAGAYNIAQDEETSVVFGMPQEAIKKGGVDKVLPLEKIANEIIQKCCKPSFA